MTEEEGFEFFREVFEIWPVEGENEGNQNSFKGIGYRRSHKKLKLTEEGKIQLKEDGGPKSLRDFFRGLRGPTPFYNKLVDCKDYVCEYEDEFFHQEDGYYIFFRDNTKGLDSPLTPVKMTTIPRGTMLSTVG